MSTATLERLGTCGNCRRQVMDNGRCLYCTTSEALELRRIVPDCALAAPEEHEQIDLLDVATGNYIRLCTARTRIGRDRRNQIVLEEDPYASRMHAFITFEDGRYWIEDLGSKNGTKVNGSYILEREPLSHADIISVGKSEFEVRSVSQSSLSTLVACDFVIQRLDRAPSGPPEDSEVN